MNNKTKAVEGLQEFVDNWCIKDFKEEPHFRCDECNFKSGKQCLIKVFAKEKFEADISCMSR